MSKQPQPRDLSLPEPGYYLFEMVRGAWAVPAQIDRTGDAYSFTVNSEPVIGSWSQKDLLDLIEKHVTAEGSHVIVRLCLYGQKCTSAEYLHRVATRQWAEIHSPRHPSLTPRTPMDPRTLPPEDF